MPIEIPRPDDASAMERLAAGTGVFTSEEIRVVGEMLGSFFNPAPQDDHTFVIYRNGNPSGVSGFASYGPTPLAERVWDL